MAIKKRQLEKKTLGDNRYLLELCTLTLGRSVCEERVSSKEFPLLRVLGMTMVKGSHGSQINDCHGLGVERLTQRDIVSRGP